MALTQEQWSSLEGMARQIGQETIANGLGSPQAQASGLPSYDSQASPRETYNQLYEIRKQASESAEARAARQERVKSNFLATAQQIMGQGQAQQASESTEEAPTNIFQKAGTSVVAGLKNTLASKVDAQRALYEAGQNMRDEQTQSQVEELEYSLAEAQRAYDQLVDEVSKGSRDFTQKDVDDKAAQIKLIQDQIAVFKKVPEAQRGATEETSKIADEIKESADKDIERIKKNSGKFGRFAIDVVTGAAQMAADRATGVLLGTNAMPALVARAFGGATQQARQGGGTIGQQLAYGSAVATVEAITEKIADGLAGAYGTGEADEIAEEVIRRLAKSPAGQTALRTLYGMGSEFAEEFISDAVNPTLRSIYNGKTIGQNYSEESVKDWLYDGLIGAATSLVSGTPERIARGQDARANAQNGAVSAIYAQMKENPSVKQAVKDRGILENIRGGKDYGNLSVGEQAGEAMEALRGATPESVRAGQLSEAQNRLFEIQQQRAAERAAAQTPAAPTASQTQPQPQNLLYNAMQSAGKPAPVQTAQEAAGQQKAPASEIAQLQTQEAAQNGQTQAPEQITPRSAGTQRQQENRSIIANMLDSGRVSNTQANAIVEDSELAEAFMELTGVKLSGTVEEKRQQIKDAVRAMSANRADSEALARQAAEQAEAEEAEAAAQRERQAQADAERAAQEAEQARLEQQRAEREAEEPHLTPEQSYVRGILLSHGDDMRNDRFGNASIREILQNPKYREAFEQLTGIELDNRNDVAYQQIADAARNMQAGEAESVLRAQWDTPQEAQVNNGQENYAKAKKVERVLSQMMTDGWRDLKNQNHDAVSDYIAAKDAINGAVKSDSWEKYLADHELALALGEATEEQLRQEWEQMHPQEEAAAVTEPETATAEAEEASAEPATVQPVEAESAGEEQSAGTIPASEQTTAERTNGTDERGYTGPLVDTQDRVFETQLTDEEKQIPGLTAEEAKHVQHHDAEVDARAKARIQNGMDQARRELLSAESWSDEDTATAGYIIQAELAAAERATDPAQKAEIYKRIAELKKQWNKQGTEEGRALRQRRRFVAEDIVSTAADILYGEKKNDGSQKALRKLKPQAKNEIMSRVRDFANRFNDMQKGKGTVGDLIQLIKDVSVQRRTTGLFSRENGRAVDFALLEVAKQEGGVDFLKELATTQIKSIASDYIKPGIIDRIKSWRFMAMLSNPATVTANAGSNFVFGSFMESLSGNLAVPFDMLMSQVTGQREVAGELGAFSRTKWQGSYDATLRSFLEVTLDAETEQADYGYKELKGGTFKMVGNPIERLLATIQKYQGYALKTTDQAAKGGTEAQVRKGLGKLAERGKAKAENIDALAQQEAKYRTLQTEGKVSTAVNKVRGAIDEAAHIGNEKTGKYGLGSDIMPFAQVPANAVAVTLETNPAIGAAKALLETAKVLRDGKNVEPGQQAKAARAWGRVANGAAVASMFAALAAKGYLRDEDDENKDIAAQRKAEGRSGVQLNISALLRGDPSEREDDLWIDFSWIPPLNGLANFGADLYRAYTEDGSLGLKDISLASWDALTSSFLDFPAVSKISSMIDTYKYSEQEGFGKLGEVVATGASQTVSGILVPNAVRAAAAGLDPYERDVYNTDSYGEGIARNLISGVPGLRETLPVRVDAYGNPVKNEGGALHYFDKTLIPGNVSRHDRQSDTSKYIESLISATGDKSLQPKRNAPYSVKVNGEKIDLSADERTEYKKRTGSAIDSLVQSALKRGMFDGLTEEQQASVVNRYESYAEDRAKAELSSERGASYSSDYSTLLQGVVRPGNGTDNDIPALQEKNAGEYIAFDTLYKGAVKSGDYSTIDNLLYRYSKLNENTRAVVDAKKPDDLSALLKFRDSGASAKDYYAIKDSIGEEQWNMDASSSTGSHVRLAGLGSADIPDSKKDKLVESGAFKLSSAAKSVYGVLRNAGLKPEQISEWFENADWYASGTGKEATADGSLNAYEVAVAISKMSGLDDSQREALYQQFKSALQKPNDAYDTWKSYNYRQTLGRAGNYGRTVGRESAPKSGNVLYDYYAERQRTG